MRTFWQRKAVSRRGILALCLAFAMTILLLPNAFGITQGAGEGSPDLTVTAVGVNSTYLELGLNVQSGETGFRSVGAVVQYDPELLTPVKWNPDATEETLQEQNAATSDREDWNNAATTLDTKGPDNLSGKTALAYVKDGTEKVGYLYLSAEAPKLLSGLNQPLPEYTPLTEGEDSTPVTTDNGVPVILPVADALTEPVEQSVVVRFKLKNPEAPDAMANALKSIDLATGDVAEASPIFDESGVAYFHNDKGESLAVNAQILRAEAGTTYFTGGTGGGTGPADPSDFVTVVCYDWDETLLGSVTVPKGATEEEVKPYMDAFVLSLQSPDSKDVDADKEAYFVDNPDYPLTYKRGYSFLTWLKNDSTIPTHCGRSYDSANGQRADIPSPVDTPDEQDFGGLTENIVVKACYQDNSELYWSDEDPSLLTYTLEVSRNSRIGATTNYIITYRFLRQKLVEENGQQVIKGVPRLVEPQLRVVYDGSQNNFFTMSTSDEVTFAIYPTATTSSAEAVVVDFYQTKVLTAAAAKSNTISETSGASALDHAGFRHKGTLGVINDELAANSTQFLTVQILRNQAGLTYTQIASARTNLRTAWLALNTVDGEVVDKSKQKDLTFEQMNYAIANNGDLLLQ